MAVFSIDLKANVNRSFENSLRSIAVEADKVNTETDKLSSKQKKAGGESAKQAKVIAKLAREMRAANRASRDMAKASEAAAQMARTNIKLVKQETMARRKLRREIKSANAGTGHALRERVSKAWLGKGDALPKRGYSPVARKRERYKERLETKRFREFEARIAHNATPKGREQLKRKDRLERVERKWTGHALRERVSKAWLGKGDTLPKRGYSPVARKRERYKEQLETKRFREFEARIANEPREGLIKRIKRTAPDLRGRGGFIGDGPKFQERREKELAIRRRRNRQATRGLRGGRSADKGGFIGDGPPGSRFQKQREKELAARQRRNRQVSGDLRESRAAKNRRVLNEYIHRRPTQGASIRTVKEGDTPRKDDQLRKGIAKAIEKREYQHREQLDTLKAASKPGTELKAKKTLVHHINKAFRDKRAILGLTPPKETADKRPPAPTKAPPSAPPPTGAARQIQDLVEARKRAGQITKEVKKSGDSIKKTGGIKGLRDQLNAESDAKARARGGGDDKRYMRGLRRDTAARNQRITGLEKLGIPIPKGWKNDPKGGFFDPFAGSRTQRERPGFFDRAKQKFSQLKSSAPSLRGERGSISIDDSDLNRVKKAIEERIKALKRGTMSDKKLARLREEVAAEQKRRLGGSRGRKATPNLSPRRAYQLDQNPFAPRAGGVAGGVAGGGAARSAGNARKSIDEVRKSQEKLLAQGKKLNGQNFRLLASGGKLVVQKNKLAKTTSRYVQVQRSSGRQQKSTADVMRKLATVMLQMLRTMKSVRRGMKGLGTEQKQLNRYIKGGGALFGRQGRWYRNYTRGVRRATTAQRKFGGSMRSSHLGMLAFGGGLFGIVYTLKRLGRGFVDLVDNVTRFQNQIRLSTTSTAQYNKVQKQVYVIARKTGNDLSFVAKIYQRIRNALERYGNTSEQNLRIVETLTKTISAFGLGAQEARGAIIQLTQGMAQGQLRGHELLSVMEQLPPIAGAIARQFNVFTSDLRAYGKEGLITTDKLNAALQEFAGEIDVKFRAFRFTFSHAATVLKTDFGLALEEIVRKTGLKDGLAGAMSEAGLQAVYWSGALDDSAEALERTAKAAEWLRAIIKGIITGIAGLLLLKFGFGFLALAGRFLGGANILLKSAGIIKKSTKIIEKSWGRKAVEWSAKKLGLGAIFGGIGVGASIGGGLIADAAFEKIDKLSSDFGKASTEADRLRGSIKEIGKQIDKTVALLAEKDGITGEFRILGASRVKDARLRLGNIEAIREQQDIEKIKKDYILNKKITAKEGEDALLTRGHQLKFLLEQAVLEGKITKQVAAQAKSREAIAKLLQDKGISSKFKAPAHKILLGEVEVGEKQRKDALAAQEAENQRIKEEKRRASKLKTFNEARLRNKKAILRLDALLDKKDLSLEARGEVSSKIMSIVKQERLLSGNVKLYEKQNQHAKVNNQFVKDTNKAVEKKLRLRERELELEQQYNHLMQLRKTGLITDEEFFPRTKSLRTAIRTDQLKRQDPTFHKTEIDNLNAIITKEKERKDAEKQRVKDEKKAERERTKALKDAQQAAEKAANAIGNSLLNAMLEVTQAAKLFGDRWSSTAQTVIREIGQLIIKFVAFKAAQTASAPSGVGLTGGAGGAIGTATGIAGQFNPKIAIATAGIAIAGSVLATLFSKESDKEKKKREDELKLAEVTRQSNIRAYEQRQEMIALERKTAAAVERQVYLLAEEKKRADRLEGERDRALLQAANADINRRFAQAAAGLSVSPQGSLPSSPGGSEQKINIAIVDDREGARQKLGGRDGRKIILNLVDENQDEIRQIL